MANIFLTSKCNLKCPYCFADEFVNKGFEEITMENFKKVVEFIKPSQERIGLIDGEPLFHPLFGEFIDLLNADEAIKNVVIFTNGIELDRWIDKFNNEKFSFLINCNSESDIGHCQYERLKNNLLLMKDKIKNFNLGINIYSKDMDFYYIFDLLKLADKHNLRFSIALPNEKKEKSKNILKDFKEIQPKLFEFFDACIENNIVPNSDCNSIPDCLLSVEEKRTLLKLGILAEKNNMPKNTTINSFRTCNPVIDILPDLVAVRCFALSKYIKVPITQFKSLANLRSYFYNKVDLYARLSFVNKSCEDCNSRMMERCGVCFAHKLSKIEKLKKEVIKRA